MDLEKRTDLALDSTSLFGDYKGKDYNVQKCSLHGIECIRVDILTKDAERAYKRKIGTYITLVCGKLAILDESSQKSVISALCDAIREILKAEVDDSFLVVGLGNRFITSDSLGPICIDKMGFLSKRRNVFLLSPSVFSQSGIESKELIKSAINATGATKLILIDALATSSLDRLCSTIQISSTGLCPGSGTNSSREKISEDEMGVPIVSIGVPTAISLSGMFFDITQGCDIKKVPICVYNSINEHSGLLVSPNEIDAIISSTSTIISRAICEVTKKNPLQL